MSSFLESMDDPDRVVRAIENNTAEFLLTMGKVGGGEERRSPAITWTIGGSPLAYHNAVVHANLVSESLDAAIQEVVERLRRHHLPGSWHLGPSMSPRDLPERLQAAGFTKAGHEPGMAAFLPALPQNLSLPEGLVIERVHDEHALNLWESTLARGFGEGETEARWVADVYRKIGLDDASWRHYLGWLDGEPVATSSMYLGAGVAGIYFVFTVPQARRRGIGSAITLAPLYEAGKMGYQVAVLGSSEAGFPVYEGLGFRQFCNFTIYEWLPDQPA